MLNLVDHWVWDSWYVDDGNDYHMFFLRASRALLDSDRRHFRASIGHARSKDLKSWTLLPDALVSSDSPAWDDLATWTGSTLLGPDNRWHLFYTGVSTAEDGLVQRIGHAISDDLLTWERVGNEPVTVSDDKWYSSLNFLDWPDQAWRDPWVFPDPKGEGFHMLLTARGREGDLLTRGVIGHATSSDLFSWKVEAPLSNPSHFGQLEVIQVESVEGKFVLVFCCAPEQVSKESRESARFAGTYSAPASSLTGPFDLEKAELIDAPHIYAGRIVQNRAGQWNLLGFVNQGANGEFVGEICDPIPLFLTERGTLQVANGLSIPFEVPE